MRYIAAVIFFFWSGFAMAQDWEAQEIFGPEDARTTLRVLSSTDIALFAPVLASFVAATPDVAVEYLVSGTADIDRIVRAGSQSFDVVISSAMDLQFKLANDGYALALDGIDFPDWAVWRRSLYAFTSEPATIVVNRQAFAEMGVPRSRQELIRQLRNAPDQFRGKVGTYDVRQSGLGYLFATQDARTSETFWRLMEVMGNLEARLYCCSSAMIEDVASGRLAVAYNVLGSYAEAREDVSNAIEIIVPSDFQTVMMRTALVSSDARHPESARAFMLHLLNAAQVTALPTLDPERPAREQSTIELEPALLTYLDRLKEQRFIAAWEESIIQ